MTASSGKWAEQLRQDAHTLYLNWPLPEVQFCIQTGWAQEYGQVFSEHFDHVLEEEKILDTVLDGGRAILSGRAGDGKTWLLRRLYKQILDRGKIPIFLDLTQWTGGDYEDWQGWTSGGVSDAADFLIRRFSGLDLGAIELDRLPPDLSKLLLVDGLNEITSPVGAQVLQLLDELVRDQINLSVFVADRLVRRELPNPTRWSIGILLPLTVKEVSKHLKSNIETEPGGVLTCPFFLDARLRYHVEGLRRSQASQNYLINHAGVQEGELDRVAAAAFDAYQRARSRVFDRAEFAELAGEPAMTALESSNTLVSASNDKRHFLHHILHDYLAARFVANLRTLRWTPQTLSELSFDSSSFDAVELVFEQLDEDRADQFLRQLYDWNLYAAGYALARARDTDACVGVETRTLIFAMLAEKRFDTILATREKADDALALMQLSDARPFRDAQSLEAVFAAVDVIESSEPWFNKWKDLFRTGLVSELTIETLASIRMRDSITGWTVANVAKRSKVHAHTPYLLSDWVQDEPNATVRWRIAHVLGAFPTMRALETLVRLLDHDPDDSVRYGAIRSIVELASLAGQEIRNVAGEAIKVRSEVISKQPRIVAELRTCLLLETENAAPDWMLFVKQVVRAFFAEAESTSERDLWRRCLSNAEIQYDDYDREARASVVPQGDQDG